MNIDTITAVLRDPTQRAIDAMFINKGSVIWVDLNEEDGNIVQACEAVLQTGSLAAEWVCARTPLGGDLYITYAGRRSRVPLVFGHEDRHITLCALNRVLTPDYQIRFSIDSKGSDVLAFVPLPTAQWQELEQRFGAAVNQHFYLFADQPNLFTEPPAFS